jgi:uncharacterized protein (TIGR02271 family)
MANYDDVSIRNKTANAANKALGSHNEPSTTGDVVGETVGGLSGAATGAALGSLGGPIGTIIGGIAGAATGWWSGRAISEAASSFDQDEDYYRNHYSSRGSSALGGSGTYDHARPAYQLGHLAGMNPDYQNRQFADVEPELRRGYESYAGANSGPAWDSVRGHVADAYSRGQERRIVLSEEQLRVGKRQVQSGEVNLRTTVETQRVQEQVGLMHEEVSIERRPLSAADASAADLTIGEETIRVPLTREEAVVEKRVVPVEEVVVRTNTVTENQTVEDTVRRERLVTEGLDAQRGTSRADLTK